MKLICAHCGDSFRVRKDQLGKMGKCPSCKRIITIPRSGSAITTAHDPLQPPSRFLEKTLALTLAIIAHLGIIGAMAMVPWMLPRRGIGGEGTEIVLGQLPASMRADDVPDKLQDSPINELPRLTESLMLSEAALMDPLGLQPATSATVPELFPGARSGGPPVQYTDVAGSQTPTGQQIEFDLFLGELKKDGLDIAITFDSTGSMQGEIDAVKGQIDRIGKTLKKLIPFVRISICTYRDQGDEYVVRGLPLTDDLGKINGFLAGISAAGGGDEPEAVDAGLRWVMENNEFRDEARKVILVFGDAPPHYDSQPDCLRMASEFRRRGGIVSTVTCRQERKSAPLAEIAQLGGGESFLTRDDRQIVAELVVLVFGSRYRDRVVQLFELAE